MSPPLATFVHSNSGTLLDGARFVFHMVAEIFLSPSFFGAIFFTLYITFTFSTFVDCMIVKYLHISFFPS